MVEYEGREKELMPMLVAKYGVEPDPPTPRAAAPRTPPPAPQDNTQAPASTLSLDVQRVRLKKYYAKYVPEKSDADIEKALTTYANSATGFDAMWKALEKKYGP